MAGALVAYLEEHRSRLFDRDANAGPTIWWDGRGGWAREADGEIGPALLEDVGADALAVIEEEAHALRTGSARSASFLASGPRSSGLCA